MVFSIVDIVSVLTDQVGYDHAKNYWKVLKHRLAKGNSELVTVCNQLKLKSPKDGKRYMTDVASNPYGHVGIYIGNGKVIHNLSGEVKVQSLESCVKDFKGFAWGWENSKTLKNYLNHI